MVWLRPGQCWWMGGLQQVVAPQVVAQRLREEDLQLVVQSLSLTRQQLHQLPLRWRLAHQQVMDQETVHLQ